MGQSEGLLGHDVVEVLARNLTTIRSCTLKHFLKLLHIHSLAKLLSNSTNVVGVDYSCMIIVEQVENFINAILNRTIFTLDSLSPSLEVIPSKNSSKSTSLPKLSRSAIMLKIVGFLL